MFFAKTAKTEVLKKNPSLSFVDLGRALGKTWAFMSADEKAPYEASAKRDMERYQAEVAAQARAQSRTTRSPYMLRSARARMCHV